MESKTPRKKPTLRRGTDAPPSPAEPRKAPVKRRSSAAMRAVPRPYHSVGPPGRHSRRPGPRARPTLTSAFATVVALLADPSSVPKRLPGDVSGLPLQPHAAFVLSAIDGHTSIQDLLDTCPLPEAEILRHLVELIELRVITLI